MTKVLYEELLACFQSMFDAFKENEKNVPVQSFLETTTALANFLDNFGIVFCVVKKDLLKNAKKIIKANSSLNPCASIQEMIQREKLLGASKYGKSGTTASVWICRGIDLVVESIRRFTERDIPVKSAIAQGYAITLRPYHRRMTRKLVPGIIQNLPGGSDFYAVLCENSHTNPAPEEIRASLMWMSEHAAEISGAITSYVRTEGICIREKRRSLR